MLKDIPSDKPVQKPYFSSLDSLRFIAAFLVLSTHCTTDRLQYLNLPFMLDDLVKVLLTGNIWVCFFFTLSGFLVTYLSLIEQKAGKFSFIKFMTRRALRIWPLYYLIIIIAFAIVPFLIKLIFNHNSSTSTIWYYITFLANFDMVEIHRTGNFSRTPGIANLTWSVAIEEQLYLLWALIFCFFRRKNIFYCIVFCILFSSSFIIFHSQDLKWIQFHSITNLLYFGWGALAAYSASQYTINRLTKIPAYLYYLVLIAGLCIFVPEEGVWLVLQKLLAGILFSILILWHCFNQKQAVSIFHNKTLIYWGKRSYGIYLIHPVFQQTLYPLLKRFYPLMDTALIDIITFSVTLVLTLICAGFSYTYFESYFLRLRVKFESYP